MGLSIDFLVSYRNWSLSGTIFRLSSSPLTFLQLVRGVGDRDEDVSTVLLKRFEIFDAGTGVEDDYGLAFLDEILVDEFA